jgi:hypothetical protein
VLGGGRGSSDGFVRRPYSLLHPRSERETVATLVRRFEYRCVFPDDGSEIREGFHFKVVRREPVADDYLYLSIEGVEIAEWQS